MYKPGDEYAFWGLIPIWPPPSPKSHWYTASSLIPLENSPIPKNIISWSTSTCIEPFEFATGSESIEATTSWHGSSQSIMACQPWPDAGGAAINSMVKHPVGLSAIIRSPSFGRSPFVFGLANVPNSSALVLLPL